MPATTHPLATQLTVGSPDARGPLVVFPVFGPASRLPYCSFAEARALGAAIHELPDGASVNDLVVRNPLEVAVLLYEGEEVRGAQQDRTLDVSVLVPAGASRTVPVSCVEHGRWDGTRHGEAFQPAPSAAFPTLRQAKNRAARAADDGRADQDEVWDLVAEESARHGADGPTGAMRDMFDARQGEIDAIRDNITRRDGQIGAVAAIEGRLCVADVVGRSDAFAALFAPLLSGYALDALGSMVDAPIAPPPAPSIDDAHEFLLAALTTTTRRRPGVGLGDEHRFASARAAGTRLEYDGEVIALTAFPGELHESRVRRASRRGA